MGVNSLRQYNLFVSGNRFGDSADVAPASGKQRAFLSRANFGKRECSVIFQVKFSTVTNTCRL